VSDFVDHIDYAVQLIGIDHVGISSDFDGGGGVVGWNDASETFNVTLELVRRRYTEEQIAKLWSGNLLCVIQAVQDVPGGTDTRGLGSRPDRALYRLSSGRIGVRSFSRVSPVDVTKSASPFSSAFAASP
jgi:hypothetical protein